MTTQYLMDTPEGKGAFIRIKSGAVDEYSIGYDAIKGGVTFVKSADGTTERHLKEIKLYEYSPVLFGMNPATTTLSAKTSDIEPEEMKPYVIAKRGDKWGVFKEGEDGSATGDALGMQDSEESAKEQPRALYANEADDKAGEIVSEIKAGRTISRATAAELRPARDVLDRLIQMAEMSQAEEPPAPDDKAADEHEHKAGPVSPPTSHERMLKLIDL